MECLTPNCRRIPSGIHRYCCDMCKLTGGQQHRPRCWRISRTSQPSQSPDRLSNTRRLYGVCKWRSRSIRAQTQDEAKSSLFGAPTYGMNIENYLLTYLEDCRPIVYQPTFLEDCCLETRYNARLEEAEPVFLHLYSQNCDAYNSNFRVRPYYNGKLMPLELSAKWKNAHYVLQNKELQVEEQNFLQQLQTSLFSTETIKRPFCNSLYPKWRAQRTNKFWKKYCSPELWFEDTKLAHSVLKIKWKAERTKLFWNKYCSPVVKSEESLLAKLEVQNREKEQQDFLNELESFILATGLSRYSPWYPLYPKRKTERTDMFWETYRWRKKCERLGLMWRGNYGVSKCNAFISVEAIRMLVTKVLFLGLDLFERLVYMHISMFHAVTFWFARRQGICLAHEQGHEDDEKKYKSRKNNKLVIFQCKI